MAGAVKGWRVAVIAAVALGTVGCAAAAQRMADPDGVPAGADTLSRTAPGEVVAELSEADRVLSERVRAEAERARGTRITISLQERKLWLIDGADTLLAAPVAVGKGTTLRHGRQEWTFDTPRGQRTVRGKGANPVWTPPLWHYVEVAKERGLTLVQLHASRPRRLGGGSRLEVRRGDVTLVSRDSIVPWPVGDEIIIGDTLYVPPFGTRQRRIPGELGSHKLDMGDGYLLHGTPHQGSIGTAATHGCLRLRDEDVAFLFRRVPVGTRVFIY